MYRYVFRFCIMTLTILTANLLTGAVTSWMVSFRNELKPVIFTLLGMLIVVVIFYPLFAKLENWVKTLSVKVVRSGKTVAGKYMGLLVAFLAGLLVLLYFYARLWYNIDLFQALIHGNIGTYF